MQNLSFTRTYGFFGPQQGDNGVEMGMGPSTPERRTPTLKMRSKSTSDN